MAWAALRASSEYDTALENPAEVQKGDAPTSRSSGSSAIRNLTKKIKTCNDFGAGGVSVAIGEIAPSLEIDLDAVPKKHEGLDGTELAISNRRSAWPYASIHEEASYFIAECDKENWSA